MTQQKSSFLCECFFHIFFFPFCTNQKVGSVYNFEDQNKIIHGDAFWKKNTFLTFRELLLNMRGTHKIKVCKVLISKRIQTHALSWSSLTYLLHLEMPGSCWGCCSLFKGDLKKSQTVFPTVLALERWKKWVGVWPAQVWLELCGKVNIKCEVEGGLIVDSCLCKQVQGWDWEYNPAFLYSIVKVINL